MCIRDSTPAAAQECAAPAAPAAAPAAVKKPSACRLLLLCAARSCTARARATAASCTAGA
eukprot:1842371-Pyramimonas_sp.AAC.1